nr:hypothetical protein [Ktedonospora formicarum]
MVDQPPHGLQAVREGPMAQVVEQGRSLDAPQTDFRDVAETTRELELLDDAREHVPRSTAVLRAAVRDSAIEKVSHESHLPDPPQSAEGSGVHEVTHELGNFKPLLIEAVVVLRGFAPVRHVSPKR